MPVRLTLHPGEDVELPDGVRLGDVRAALARIVRRPELLRGDLVADGTPVDDDAVVGRRPLLPGATLRTAADPTPSDPDRDALRSDWVVRAVTGLSAGEPLPLGPGQPVLLGDRVRVTTDRRGRPRIHPARFWQRAPWRRTRQVPPVLRRPGPGRERRRRVTVPRPWYDADLVEVAGVTFALHRSGDAVSLLAPIRQADEDGPVVRPAMLLVGIVPVLGSVALAVAMRQPLYALFSLVGVAALVPQVLALLRRRRRGEEPSEEARGPVGSDPGRTIARVAALHEVSDGAWDAALARVARDAATGGHRPSPDRGASALVPDGALAVRGPAGAVRAVARSVVLDLAAAGAAVRVVGPGRGLWSWCRWLTPSEPDVGVLGACVLVVDGLDAVASRAADEARRRGDVVVLCLPDPAEGPTTETPGWFRTLLSVRDGEVRWTAPDGAGVIRPTSGVTVDAAGRTARRLAGLRALGRSLGDLGTAAGSDGLAPGTNLSQGLDRRDDVRHLPGTVPLAELLDLGDPTARWSAPSGWEVPLGRSDAGPVTLDLVADGPHLLVAGTTGSGKSELLQSLVLGLALTRSPADLALVLVDFKGGASFGRCADLPHVVGQVTDLEPGLAARALAGLRAELRRRERVLATHRAASLQDAPDGTLPRLVVVIDEFRALADELPDFLPGLLRVAAQGRSLGVHLVLATQRPAGAVGPDVRANISARIALRVVDDADSHDVVGSAAAARIPVTSPGRAVLRVGSAPAVVVQCAHAAAVVGDGPRVRRATPWRGLDPVTVPAGRPRTAVTPAGPDVVAGAVSAARAAADALGHRAGPAPWLPPLPAEVAEDRLGQIAPDVPPGLPLALADDPEQQRQHVVSWDPAAGHLAVLGRARSGRTTTLLALATAALARGWHVHALVPAADVARFRVLTRHPGFGTLAGPHDPRRARRLLRLLSSPEHGPAGDGAAGHRPPPVGVLVVVDGVEDLRGALSGVDPWDPLTSALAAAQAAFAVTAESASAGGLAARCGPRVVLLGTDQHQDVVLGAPSGLAGTGGPPGRAAWLAADGAASCQVLAPSALRVGSPDAVSRPVRLRALPAAVEAADVDGAEAADPDGVVVGIGGDDARPVVLDVAGGALVVGPRGSGRTAVLRRVVGALAPTGRLAGVVSRDAALRAEAGAVPSAGGSPSAVRALLEGLWADDAPAAHGRFLVVDDLDLLAQSCPVEVDRLGAPDQPFVLVASATTQGTLMAHRGPLAELRGRRTGLVLSPSERGSDEVLGTPLADVVEAGPPRPGRGAIVRAGSAAPVQTVRPPATGATDGRSAGRVLHHAAGHEPDEGERGCTGGEHTAQDRPGGAAGQQGEPDEQLEDLPAGDDGAAAAPPVPQRPAAGGERPGQGEEEDHHEDGDADVRRAAAHQLQDDRRGEDDEGQDLERDDGQHGRQEAWSWAAPRGRVGGFSGLRSRHHP